MGVFSRWMHRAVAFRRTTLVTSMILAISFAFGLAYWDAQREFSGALQDFAGEQTTLAEAVASNLQVWLASGQGTFSAGAEAPPFPESVERPGELRIFLQPPTESLLLDENGTHLRSPTISQAIARGDRWVGLPRAEAHDLGLATRSAVAAFKWVDGGPHGNWVVAVVATAGRQRDRAIRAQWRLILTITATSVFVLAFGGWALRTQRKELELSREVAVAAIEKRRDERLVRADKLATLGALAMGIAHEVATPLSVLIGRAEQLRSRMSVDDRSRRGIDQIIQQADRINQVMRGFLNLARGNGPRLEHVDATVPARTALELVEHRFQKARVRILSEIPSTTPQIACEPRLFEQVLVNLLLNACDACRPEGTVVLAIRVDGHRVRYLVIDDGPGISQEAAQQATEPFFTTKSEGEGTGLGLAIANEIVKHHR